MRSYQLAALLGAVAAVEDKCGSDEMKAGLQATIGEYQALACLGFIAFLLFTKIYTLKFMSERLKPAAYKWPEDSAVSLGDSAEGTPADVDANSSNKFRRLNAAFESDLQNFVTMAVMYLFATFAGSLMISTTDDKGTATYHSAQFGALIFFLIVYFFAQVFHTVALMKELSMLRKICYSLMTGCIYIVMFVGMICALHKVDNMCHSDKSIYKGCVVGC